MRAVAGFGILLAAAACTTGCGSTRVSAPFVVSGREEGPTSGAWGDTVSGPGGMHLGCIDGRRLAVLLTAHNRTRRTIVLLGGSGAQAASRVIDRVAVQVRRAPPPPTGDQMVVGLRAWSRRTAQPVTIPAGRDAWVQLNFTMHNCASLGRGRVVIANRRLTLAYRAGGREDTQTVSVHSARIFLTRGPRDPGVPINQTG